MLVYDHRCLGASDGEPRQVINPWAQTRDYRSAIGWLTTTGSIATASAYGDRASAGEVLVLGAVDDHVRAVVASVPFAGLGTEYGDPADVARRFAAIREALVDLSGRGPADATNRRGPLAVVHEPGAAEGTPVFLGQPESAKSSRRRSPAGVALAEPGVVAPPRSAPSPRSTRGWPSASSRCRRCGWWPPTTRSRPQRSRWLRTDATGDKQLEMVVGHHFTGYAGEALDHSAAVELEFLLRHL